MSSTIHKTSLEGIFLPPWQTAEVVIPEIEPVYAYVKQKHLNVYAKNRDVQKVIQPTEGSQDLIITNEFPIFQSFKDFLKTFPK